MLRQAQSISPRRRARCASLRYFHNVHLDSARHPDRRDQVRHDMDLLIQIESSIEQLTESAGEVPKNICGPTIAHWSEATPSNECFQRLAGWKLTDRP